MCLPNNLSSRFYFWYQSQNLGVTLSGKIYTNYISLFPILFNFFCKLSHVLFFLFHIHQYLFNSGQAANLEYASCVLVLTTML